MRHSIRQTMGAWAGGAMMAAAVALATGAAPAHPTPLAARPFIQDVAKHLGVSSTRLQQAIVAAQLDRIQAAVQAGKLTQQQASRLEERVRAGHAWVGLCPHPLHHHRRATPAAMPLPAEPRAGAAQAPLWQLTQQGARAVAGAGQWTRREEQTLLRDMGQELGKLKRLTRPLP